MPLTAFEPTTEHAADVAAALAAIRDGAASVVARAQELRERGARALAESGGPPRLAAKERSPLTPRQLEVLALFADGLGTREIAARLYLSVTTIRNHVAAILVGLDAHSRLEAVAKARRLELL